MTINNHPQIQSLTKQLQNRSNLINTAVIWVSRYCWWWLLVTLITQLYIERISQFPTLPTFHVKGTWRQCMQLHKHERDGERDVAISHVSLRRLPPLTRSKNGPQLLVGGGWWVALVFHSAQQRVRSKKSPSLYLRIIIRSIHPSHSILLLKSHHHLSLSLPLFADCTMQIM